jgi:hypothetical protein
MSPPGISGTSGGGSIFAHRSTVANAVLHRLLLSGSSKATASLQGTTQTADISTRNERNIDRPGSKPNGKLQDARQHARRTPGRRGITFAQRVFALEACPEIARSVTRELNDLVMESRRFYDARIPLTRRRVLRISCFASLARAASHRQFIVRR